VKVRETSLGLERTEAPTLREDEDPQMLGFSQTLPLPLHNTQDRKMVFNCVRVFCMYVLVLACLLVDGSPVDDLMDRGIAQGNAGNETGALHHFLLALAADPNNSNVLNNVAVSYMRLGRIKEARQHLERCIDFAPFGDNAFHNMWETYKLEQKSLVDPLEAEAQAKQGLPTRPL